MRDEESLVVRLVAYVQALLPRDWGGRAGRRARETFKRISDFTENHQLQPKQVLEEGIVLGRTKLTGLARKEFAEVTKNFADAEQKKIETELQRRVLESKVRKEEAEARVAELKVMDAEVELFKKMKEIGVILRRDGRGNLTILPSLPNCDLTQLGPTAFPPPDQTD